MKRPLCVFCFSALGAQAAFVFLPQAALWPLAAFFIAGALGVWLRRRHGYCLCLLAGAVLGLALAGHSAWRADRISSRYDGQELVLAAKVESVSSSYYEGTVRAQLLAETPSGEKLRCLCLCMPACEAGDRVTGRFTLAAPGQSERLERYADGVFLLAEYQNGFAVTGKAQDFRAATHRLQQEMSAALRRGLDEDAGGVLAAMTVGDRSHLSGELNAAYRAAGLSHVLVVSGMHVSILCGGVFTGLSSRRKQEKTRRSRVGQAVAGIGAAILLAGITGFTPSVLRAGAAVLVSGIGALLLAPADALTSLGLAGLCMTLGNSYAVCDVGFELSFAAVLGTLAGAEAARRARRAWTKPKKEKGSNRRGPTLRFRGRLADVLLDTVCISLGASAATFPILVLQGMSASLYGLVSGVAVLWMVKPILLCGMGAALAGLVPPLGPLYTLLAFCGGLLARAMNTWVRFASGLPGAQLYFETGYAAVVCLVLIGLCLLAACWKVRLRWAAPVILMTAAAAVFLGNALSRDVVSVAMVGSSRSPVVIVTENRRAMVLFRGGSSEQYAVESYLAKRSIQAIDLLIDLRTDPGTACTLEAEHAVSAAELAAYRTERLEFQDTAVELFCTRTGNLARLTVGDSRLITLSGSVALAQKVRAEYLLASAARPDAFVCDQILTLSEGYSWLEQQDPALVLAGKAGLTLRLRPGGGARVEGAG